MIDLRVYMCQLIYMCLDLYMCLEVMSTERGRERLLEASDDLCLSDLIDTGTYMHRDS